MTQTAPNILVIGTGDTKADEITFIARKIRDAGGIPVLMDVSILGDPPYMPEHDKHAVAAAAGHTIEEIIASTVPIINQITEEAKKRIAGSRID